MKQFCLVLALISAGLFVTTDSTEAQGKKSPPSKTGTIELIESKDGKYRFSVRDGEGKYLAGSPVGHDTEKEAREAAESLKTVIATAKFVSKKSSTDKDK